MPNVRERGVSRVREQRLRQGGLFVPLVFSFAASLEGMSPEDFLASPTKVANGLRTVFASFGVDGVAGWCDNTAPADTLSCTLDWCTYPPVVVEAPSPEGMPGLDSIGVEGATGVAAEVVRRLGALLPDTVLVGTMPGPVTLARQMAAPGRGGSPPVQDLDLLRVAATACLALGKALGEAGLDVLLVHEERLLVPGDDLPSGDVARLYSSIWNTARFYGLAAMLALGGGDANVADTGRGGSPANTAAGLLPLAGVVDGLAAPPASLEEWSSVLGKGLKRLGVALPSRLPGESADAIGAYLRGHAIAERVRDGRLFLVTTDGEVPPDVDRAALIAGIETIRDHVRGGVAHGG